MTDPIKDGMIRWIRLGRKDYILEVDFKRRIAAILTMGKKTNTKIIWRSDDIV